jgi:hypothetical protein
VRVAYLLLPEFVGALYFFPGRMSTFFPRDVRLLDPRRGLRASDMTI